METTNRNLLLSQLEETRNTVQRQHLLKQLWRLDRQETRCDEALAATPPPVMLAVPVSAK